MRHKGGEALGEDGVEMHHAQDLRYLKQAGGAETPSHDRVSAACMSGR